MAYLGDVTSSMTDNMYNKTLALGGPVVYQWKKLEGILKYEGVAGHRRFVVLDASTVEIIYAGASHPDGTIRVGCLTPAMVVRGVTVMAYDDAGVHNAQVLDDIVLADQ